MADNKPDKLERIYIVPLGDAYEHIRTKRTKRAVKLLKQFLSRHMKSNEVLISNALNSSLWTRGIQKPPRKVKVRAIRDNGVVNAYLINEKTVDEKKAEQPKKAEKTKEEQKKEKPEEVKKGSEKTTVEQPAKKEEKK